MDNLSNTTAANILRRVRLRTEREPDVRENRRNMKSHINPFPCLLLSIAIAATLLYFAEVSGLGEFGFPPSTSGETIDDCVN
jgi:hypothetical protein